MKRIFYATAAILMGIGLSACEHKMSAADHKGPTFDPLSYYNGDIKAWGAIQDFGSDLSSRFEIAMHGEWSGDTGTLNEKFTYYDGTKYERTWTLKKVSETEFTGTAPDVIGTAKGTLYGNTLHWEYDTRVPQVNPEHKVHFSHWAYAMNDGIVINRIRVTKLGVYVSDISIMMQKQ